MTTSDPHPLGGIYVGGRSKAAYIDAIRSLMLPEHRAKLVDVLILGNGHEVWGYICLELNHPATPVRNCNPEWQILKAQGKLFTVGFIRKGSRLLGWPE